MTQVYRIVTRIQDLDDFSGSLTNDYFISYDSALQKFKLKEVILTPGGSNGQLQFNNTGEFDGVEFSNVATSGNLLTLTSQDVNDTPLAIKGIVSQSAVLTKWLNSAGTALSYVANNGNITAPQFNSTIINLQASADATQITAGVNLSNNSGIQYYPNHVQLFVDSICRGIFDNQNNFRLPSDNGIGWSSSTNNLTGSDVKFVRYSTGPALETRADGGLRVRNFAGTADAAITAGAGTFNGDLRCATGTNGLYFCTTGNTAGRISMFGADFYIDNNAGANTYFRTNTGTNQPLGLKGSNVYVLNNITWSQNTASFTNGAVIELDAIDTLSQRRGTNTQQFNIYGTYTSATSREYLKLRGVSAANFEIGPSNGSAGGTLRGLTIGGYVNDSATITPWLTFTNTGAASFSSTVSCTTLTTGYGTGLILGDSYSTLSVGSGQITVRALNVDMWKFSSGFTAAKSNVVIGWSSGAVSASNDTGIARNAAGVAEVNNGTAGTYGGFVACNYTATAGTITTSKPYSVTQTWNNASTTFSLFDASITPTLASTSSYWINFASTTMWGGNNYPTFSASIYSGVLTICGIWGDATLVLGGPSIGARIVPVYGTGLRISPQGAGNYTMRIGTHGASGSNTQFENWNVANSLVFTGTGFSAAMAWDASNVYAQRNGTNAQTWRLENTYTSATNREYFQQSWVSNELRIGNAVGSAGGTVRDTVFGSWNAAGTFTQAMNISGTTWNISGPLASAWTIASGSPVQAATTTAGNNITIRASSAVAGSSTNGAAAGGSVFIYGGDGTRLNTGTAAGGDITIRPGAPSIGGTPGTLYLTGALGTTQSAAGDVRITGGTATQTNNNLQMGHVYISTVGSDNYFIPGTIQLSTGFGSQNTNAGGTGGAGGAITQTTGYGGAANTGSGVKAGGAGGAFTFTTGYGGASSSGTTSNTGGNGGAYSFTTGVGGAATGTAATGGNGGAFTITTGAGGNGATTNGNGGNILFTAGIAGVGAGTAGVAGTITFNQAGVNKLVMDASGLTVNQASASVVAQTWQAAASATANVLEVFHSSGNKAFYVTSGGQVVANRAGTVSGSFAASETSSGYAFLGGWGGIRANGGSPALGNILTSPYGWEFNCGSGYGVHILNGTNAQFLDIYNTFTSSTNLEKGRLLWTSNQWRIGTAVGSAGGSLRDITIGSWNAAGTYTTKVTIPISSTGAFYLGPPADSTATGGNARGSGAVDFQTSRSSASQVASGVGSFIGGGVQNTVSSSYGVIGGGGTNEVSANFGVCAGGDTNTVSGIYGCILGGNFNVASATYSSILGGVWGLADRYGMEARSSGRFSSNGDNQKVSFITRNKTTDGVTDTTLFLDGSSTRLTIPSGKGLSAMVTVKGFKSDGSVGARFRRMVDIKNVGGTTSLETTPETIGTDYNPSFCTLSITADDTNDALKISIIGIASETWRWIAVVDGVELAYGT